LRDIIFNPTLHGLFLHPILEGGEGEGLCDFLLKARRIKIFGWSCKSDPKFF